jgi:hypothetical protein
MRMTAHDYSDTARLQIEVKFSKIVKHVDRLRLNLDQVVLEEAAGPSAMVIVAAYRANRRDSSKCFQNRGIADVAAMNDQIGAAKRLYRLWPD